MLPKPPTRPRLPRSLQTSRTMLSTWLLLDLSLLHVRLKKPLRFKWLSQNSMPRPFNFHRAKESQVSVHRKLEVVSKKQPHQWNPTKKTSMHGLKRTALNWSSLKSTSSERMLFSHRLHRLPSPTKPLLWMRGFLLRTRNRLAPNSRTWFLTSKSKSTLTITTTMVTTMTTTIPQNHQSLTRTSDLLNRLNWLSTWLAVRSTGHSTQQRSSW